MAASPLVSQSAFVLSESPSPRPVGASSCSQPEKPPLHIVACVCVVLGFVAFPPGLPFSVGLAGCLRLRDLVFEKSR